MNRLCHKSPLAASYIIYGNALKLETDYGIRRRFS
jgi:hypothetical protein